MHLRVKGSRSPKNQTYIFVSDDARDSPEKLKFTLYPLLQ